MDVSELKVRLNRVASMAEKSYWDNRKFIDEHVPDWIHGDDGPSYPFMRIRNMLEIIVKQIEG